MAVNDNERSTTRGARTRDAAFARMDDSRMSMYVVVALILALVVGAVALFKGDSTDLNRSTAQDDIRATSQRNTAPTTATKQP